MQLVFLLLYNLTGFKSRSSALQSDAMTTMHHATRDANMYSNLMLMKSYVHKNVSSSGLVSNACL
jgi:hypothetical protein